MLYGAVHGIGVVSGLSTKHVVLGLLIERPGYGYDLQQRLQSRLGFLALSESAVYKILDRLEQDGYIEEMGEKRVGRTRRGAARVMYRATHEGEQHFRGWVAQPSERPTVRDELQAKLMVTDPGDLPELVDAAEAQSRACLTELSAMSRPSLARAASPDVPWNHAAVMMVDDFTTRWLQLWVDWLDAICEVMDERMKNGADPPPPPR
jgi:DNA-binding PadR family transcriptional regulator